MIHPYFTTFLIILLIFLTECTGAEKKQTFQSGNTSAFKNTEVIQKLPVTGNSGINKTTTVKKPADFIIKKPETVSFKNDDIKVTLYAKAFAQGNGVYCEIEFLNRGYEPRDISVYYKNIPTPVTKTSWGHRSLWGIDPEEKPGNAQVTVNYSINGEKKAISSGVKIRDVDFPVSKTMLNVGKFSDKDYYSDPKFKDLIAQCAAMRQKAFSIASEDKIESAISHPRNMHTITGDFWRKRIYLNYKIKNKKRIKISGLKSFHRGLDLKGNIGDPVYAMADGMVVLSYTMFWEGNMVVIDHGNQVFSYYQHMDSRNVKEDQMVKAGDLIGAVGATGMVTGPHLHVAFSIRGVHVDPLSILSLPVSR